MDLFQGKTIIPILPREDCASRVCILRSRGWDQEAAVCREGREKVELGLGNLSQKCMHSEGMVALTVQDGVGPGRGGE